MTVHNTHYGPGLASGTGTSRARDIVDRLSRECMGQYPVLVCRGMSGMSLAARVSTLMDIDGIPHGMIYVRKAGENSHGIRVETAVDKDHMATAVAVFVDDFIGTGNTRDATLSEVYGAFHGASSYVEALGGGWPNGMASVERRRWRDRAKPASARPDSFTLPAPLTAEQMAAPYGGGLA